MCVFPRDMFSTGWAEPLNSDGFVPHDGLIEVLGYGIFPYVKTRYLYLMHGFFIIFCVFIIPSHLKAAPFHQDHLEGRSIWEFFGIDAL